MKIAVWKTGHEIADRVAEAVHFGLKSLGIDSWLIIYAQDQAMIESFVSDYDIHIGYGILRGMDKVFRACDKTGKPWFNIDKGYWKPGHYEGYYRVSLRGTQQTTLSGLEPNNASILNIPDGLSRCSWGNEGRKTLICPPTDYVANFFDINPYEWLAAQIINSTEYLIRDKNCKRSLQDDLDQCNRIMTFNSSVGWEALRQGIEVVSDPNHSIVGAYQKLVDRPLHLDYEERRKLFAIQSSLQLTLEEMRQGMLWPLLHKLLSISGSMDAKPLPAMSSPTVFPNAHLLS